MFCADLGGGIGKSDRTKDQSHIPHGTAPGLFDLGYGETHAIKDTGQVDVDRFLPDIKIIAAGRCRRPADPGIVHNAMQSTGLFHREIDHGFDLIGSGNIKVMGLAAPSDDQARDRLGVLHVQVGHDQGRATVGQLLGRSGTDARAATRHDHCLAIKAQIHFSPPTSVNRCASTIDFLPGRSHAFRSETMLLFRPDRWPKDKKFTHAILHLRVPRSHFHTIIVNSP